MFAEDLSVFLADFGLPVVYGAIQTTGILDMPGQTLLGDVSSNDYGLTYATATMPSLKVGDRLTVGGIAYIARNPNPEGDGAFSHAPLTKV